MPAGPRIVLQARVSSTRLAGKALLPVGGIPMVALAAKRAARSGMNVVVAIPEGSYDDPIVKICGRSELITFRGSADNVYSRFIGATADLDDDAIVVRVTADNVFPDADLIDDLVDRLRASGAAYVAPIWPHDGLPYGVTAEAFRLSALRQSPPSSSADAEHVTTALLRSMANQGFQSGLALSHLRATVDTPDDYGRVAAVFRDVENPIEIGWRALCDRLAALPTERVPCICRGGHFQSQLTLGGAQFGSAYGIANTVGLPSPSDVTRIIHAAIDHGVTHIDTARLYGASEERIGTALEGDWHDRAKIITKLPPIEAATAAAAEDSVEMYVRQSLRALRLKRLDTVLLHRADTYAIAGGAAWRRLLRLKEEGVIGRLGVSVQTPDEFARVSADPYVEQIQLPFNLLDRRWDGCANDRSDLSVHARSVFLQGLLTEVAGSRWPRVAGVDAETIVRLLNGLARDLNRQSVADLAFAYCRSHGWIDSFVIGVETEAQLMDNIALSRAPVLAGDEIAEVRRRIPPVPDSLIDPVQWPR